MLIRDSFIAKALIVFLHIPGSQAAVQAGDARVASVQAQHQPLVLDLWKTPGSADEDQAEREPDQKTNISAQ